MTAVSRAGSSSGTTIFTVMTALAEETGAVNLGQGFPDEDGPSAVDAMRAGHNQYAPLPGVPALREAIAAHQQRRYGLAVDPDTGVQVTFGATEALASAVLALVGPGEEVAMLDPAYDSYEPVVRRAGGAVRRIPLSPPDWRVEGEAVARAVTPRTRVLLLNTPHNPTGKVFGADDLTAIAELAIRLHWRDEDVPAALMGGGHERDAGHGHGLLVLSPPRR